MFTYLKEQNKFLTSLSLLQTKFQFHDDV